ncbi:MAG: DPP IV N-terminal domain-containing protein [Saprospiraceae bacterium]|nr:DPP IV N-terminal domain-containing protein [Saprospiraceae bacterium]
MAIGQETAIQKTLTLDRIFASSDFAQEHFGPHKWLAQGEYYTTVEYNDLNQSELVLYDSETGERTLLIPAEELVDSETQDQIQIEDYSWSNDERTALIFTRSERVWRDNTQGDYYIHDLESKMTKRIGKGLYISSLLFAKFSPDGKKVAYVSAQNIYVEELQSGAI